MSPPRLPSLTKGQVSMAHHDRLCGELGAGLASADVGASSDGLTTLGPAGPRQHKDVPLCRVAAPSCPQASLSHARSQLRVMQAWNGGSARPGTADERDAWVPSLPPPAAGGLGEL